MSDIDGVTCLDAVVCNPPYGVQLVTVTNAATVAPLQVLAVYAAQMAVVVAAIYSAAHAEMQPTTREPVKSKHLTTTDGRKYGVHA